MTTQEEGRVDNLALKGADLLGKAADRLAASGWIETGMVVFLVGRALVGGHRFVRKARAAGHRVCFLDMVRFKQPPSHP